MDDLSEKLAGILNDPESMERVRKMAESILGEGAKEKEEAPSPEFDISSLLGMEDIGRLMSILAKFRSSGNDPKAQLLYALKPHLSPPRREKVDTAVKILKIIELLPLIGETGILKL